MAIEKCIVRFIREYQIEINKESSDEYIIKLAESEFNKDMQFGFITVDDDCFSIELIKEDD